VRYILSSLFRSLSSPSLSPSLSPSSLLAYPFFSSKEKKKRETAEDRNNYLFKASCNKAHTTVPCNECILCMYIPIYIIKHTFLAERRESEKRREEGIKLLLALLYLT
jgi:hypothetical protein